MHDETKKTCSLANIHGVHRCDNSEEMIELTDPHRTILVAFLNAVGDHSTAETLDNWTGTRRDFVCTTFYTRASKYMGLPTQCGLYKLVVHECDRKSSPVVRVSELCRENLIQYLERLKETDSAIATVRKWDHSQTICDSLYRLANGHEPALKQGTKRSRDVCLQLAIPHECDGHETMSPIDPEFRDTVDSFCSSKGFDGTDQVDWQQPTMCCIVPHSCDLQKRSYSMPPEFRSSFDSYCTSLGYQIKEQESICNNIRRRITKWTRKKPRAPIKHEFSTRSMRLPAPVAPAQPKQQVSIAQEIEQMMKVRFFDLEKCSDDQVANILMDIIYDLVEDPDRRVQLVARSQALLR